MKAIQLQRYDEISFNDWLSENIFQDCDPFLNFWAFYETCLILIYMTDVKWKLLNKFYWIQSFQFNRNYDSIVGQKTQWNVRFVTAEFSFIVPDRTFEN